MRSNEERVEAVRRRVAEIERQKRRQKSWIAAVSAVAACLAVIIGLSLFMPGISESLSAGNYANYATAAGIFTSDAAIGYIIIGLLAFVLGVCVTILCFKLKAFQEQGQETEEENDRVHR